MANYHVIRSTGSDSNDGLSEANAFETIAHGITVAFHAGTGGNVVWVKGGGETYSDPGNLTSTYNMPTGFNCSVSGYGATINDDCVGTTYPTVHGSMYIIARGWGKENLSFLFDGTSNPNVVPAGVGQNAGHARNINIHLVGAHANGHRGGCFRSETGTVVHNIRVTTTDGFSFDYSDRALGNGNGAAKSENNGIFCDLSGVISTGLTDNYFYNLNSNNYTGPSFNNITCVAPDPSVTPYVGIAHKYSDSNAQMFIRGCVFVNCDIGIKLYTTDHVNSSELMSSWPANAFLIENCMFINCNKGIELQSGMDWPLPIRNCVFYNNTVGNISGSALNVTGSKIATQNPWDSTKGVLTEYGASLLPEVFGGMTLGSFNEVNELRPTYQSLAEATAAFSVTDSGNLPLGGSGVGDKITVSGRTYQLVSVDPTVWRRADA